MKSTFKNEARVSKDQSSTPDQMKTPLTTYKPEMTMHESFIDG